MTDKPILWMRHKPFLNREPELYHIQRNNYPIQETHYFYTLCHKEIKGLYDHWDIIENPPVEQCCPECLKLLKEKEISWW